MTPSPEAQTLWLKGLGRTLYPLVGTDDAVQVAPCAASELEKGDLVVGRTSDGRWVGHVVLAQSPLVTSPLLGPVAADALEVRGRLTAFRRAGHRIAWPRLLSPLSHAACALANRARQSEATRRIVRRLKGALTSKTTLRVRQWLSGPVSIRDLGAADRDVVTLFAAAQLSLAPDFVARQLVERWPHTGAAVGAFDARGRMIGFAFLDDYRQEDLPIDGFWIRSVMVLPRARGFGIAQKLVQRLCVKARAQGHTLVRAAIEHDNVPSLRLFAGLGFLPAPQATSEGLNATWRAHGSTRRWVIVERAP